jgi:hypothetical protein
MQRLPTIALGVTLSIVLGTGVWSQTSSSSPGFTQMVTTTVKASAVGDYEDYLKKLAAARDKIGLRAPARTTVYTYRMGGPLFTYLSATPFANWAEIDSWLTPSETLTKAYGELEGGKVIKMMRAAVESQTIEVMRISPDLSRNLAAAPPPYTFAVMNRIELEPGTGPSYNMALTKIKAATEKAGNFPPQLVATIVHGPTPTYIQVTPFTKWADRDATTNINDALDKMYGENERRAILEIPGKLTKSRQSFVIMQRADLSWTRKSPTTIGAPASERVGGPGTQAPDR